MTHVIISIDDQPNGDVNVITHCHPAIVGDKPNATPATELADFLMKAVEVWHDTRHTDMPQAAAFVQSVTTKPTIN